MEVNKEQEFRMWRTILELLKLEEMINQKHVSDISKNLKEMSSWKWRVIVFANGKLLEKKYEDLKVMNFGLKC